MGIDLEKINAMVESLIAISNDLKEIKENIEIQEADGCEGCAFMSVEEWEMPCCKCKRSCKDYWRRGVKNE